MGENKKTRKEASSENYFALKSGYDQHTNPYNQMASTNESITILSSTYRSLEARSGLFSA